MSSPQTVHPPQCIPPNKAGNQIVNGGFETNGGYLSQVIANWVLTGYWEVGTIAIGQPPYDGTYYAYSGNQPHIANKLLQTLVYPVPVASITACGFYASIFSVATQITVTIHYTDNSSSSPTFNVTTGVWTYYDLMSYLTAGKMVDSIQIVDNGPGNTDTCVDDAILTGIAAPPSGPRLFYSPQST